MSAENKKDSQRINSNRGYKKIIPIAGLGTAMAFTGLCASPHIVHVLNSFKGDKNSQELNPLQADVTSPFDTKSFPGASPTPTPFQPIPPTPAPTLAPEPEIIDGTFMNPQTIPNIGEFMKELKEGFAMNLVIINNVRVNKQGCGGKTYDWEKGINEFPQILDTIFKEAEKLDMKVVVGLTSTFHFCSSYFQVPETIEDARKTVRFIEDQWGESPSFLGYYIPEEINISHLNLNQESNTCESDGVCSFLTNYVKAIKEEVGGQPERKIIVSPYQGTQPLNPDELSERIKVLKNATGVDIIAFQDGVGAGAYLNVKEGYTLKDYTDKLDEILGDSLWVNHESFNCCTFNFGGGAYQPASGTRLGNQLEATANFNGVRITWIAEDKLIPISVNNFQAQRLRDYWQARLGRDGRTIIQPTSYFLEVPDSENSIDITGLFDGKAGNPQGPMDGWIRLPPNSEIMMDLGETKTIDWVAAQLVNKIQLGLGFPNKLILFSSTDGVTWQEQGIWNSPVNKNDSEYVLQNEAPLGLSSRYLKLKFESNENSDLAIGEIELVSAASKNNY